MDRRHASYLAAPLLVALAAPRDELSFAPEEGLKLVRTFSFESESESDGSSSQGMSWNRTSSRTRELVVTDEILAAEDARITRLERTYEELATEGDSSSQFNGETRDMAYSGTSELQGVAVLFEWDEDDEEYVASNDETDSDVLDELLYDFDFTALLPDGEVSEDDEWTVDGELFDQLMDPWDGIPWDYENGDGDTWSTADQGPRELEKSVDGEVSVTYAGTRDEDGATVAVLELAGEIERETSSENVNEFDSGTSTSLQESTATITLEGELLWHLEEGRLYSLTVETEESTSTTSQTTFRFGDNEFESETSNEVEGSSTFTVEVEVGG